MAVVVYPLGQQPAAPAHRRGLVGMGLHVADGPFPAGGVVIRYGNAALLTVEIYGYLWVTAAKYGQPESHGLDNGGQADGILGLLTTDSHAGVAVDKPREALIVGLHIHVNAHIVAYGQAWKERTVVFLAVDCGHVHIDGHSRMAESSDERGEIAALLARGYVAAATEMLSEQAVVEVEVGSPVAHVHAPRVYLAGKHGVADELLGEEKHLVDATVEQPSEQFPHTAAGPDDRLVVPQDYRLAEQVERAQEYQWLYARVVGGIDSVYPAVMTEHAPCSEQHQTEARGIGYIFVPLYLEAHFLKMGGSIEQMARIVAVAVLAEYVLYVLCMVEIDSHLQVKFPTKLLLLFGILVSKDYFCTTI